MVGQSYEENEWLISAEGEAKYKRKKQTESTRKARWPLSGPG